MHLCSVNWGLFRYNNVHEITGAIADIIFISYNIQFYLVKNMND